jgi:hypothetical protein
MYTSVMTKRLHYVLLVSGIVVMLLVAGCVTPPKSSSGSTSGGSSVIETTTEETPASPAYVTAATPFVTTGAALQSSGSGYSNPYATPTPIPTDLSCLIYQNTQYFSQNSTAVSFDLKKPPMYITYSVVPFNITVTRSVPSPQGGNQMITLQYSDYAPYSWFQVSVLDKSTGNIFYQNGFGKAPGISNLSIYTNATLGPVLNSGDLLVQMTGNNITATTGIWVKPVGNFDDPQNQSFTQCQYWNGQPQNYLVYPTTTATPTWTPGNVQTPND